MSYSMDHQIKNHSQIRFHKKSLKWVKPWKWGMKLIAYCSMFFSRTMDQNFVVYENESWFHYGIYSWKLGVEKSIGSWDGIGANCRDRWLKKRNMAWHYKWLLSTSYKRWSHTELQGLASCTSCNIQKKKFHRLDKQAQKNIEMLRLSTATIITLCSRNIFLHFLFCVFCKWMGCANVLEL